MRLVVSSKLAEHNQARQDDEDEAEPAAAIVACRVKRAAAEPTKTSE
jgi:hypothetical protein